MKDKLTILQNFIIGDSLVPGRAPKWAKINHIHSNIGLVDQVRIFGDCKWVVNYKEAGHAHAIRNLYERNISHLSFHNVLDSPDYDWAKETLKLLEEVDTPYVFYLTEDRIFENVPKEEWVAIIEEMYSLGVEHMPIGKPRKYIHKFEEAHRRDPARYRKYSNLYTCNARDTLFGVIMLDSIFTKKLLEECLRRVIATPSEQFKCPRNYPHTLERGPKWFPTERPEMIQAHPTKEIVFSDIDSGYTRLS
jgi:hypothetical protein